MQNKNPRGKDCIFYVLYGTRICVHDCERNFFGLQEIAAKGVQMGVLQDDVYYYLSGGDFYLWTDEGGMQKWKEPKKTISVRFPQGAVYLEKRGEERGTF